MVQLPSDPRFDSWRDCGSDLAAARDYALSKPARAAGSVEEILARTVWPDGLVIRGTVDPATGEPLSRFAFPKSLSAIYEPWNSGADPNVSIYSWRDGFCKAAPGATVIVMDMGFECPDVAYAGHHKERGHNPIHSTEPTSRLILINPWFYNCDSAFVVGGRHSHVFNPVVTTRGTKRVNPIGHYGGRLVGADNVIEGDFVRLNFTHECHHDLSTQVTRHSVYCRLRMKRGVLDYHCYSNDEQDDDNLHAFIAGVDRGITIGGADKNKPWEGDNNHLHRITRTDGSKVAVPGALNAIIIPDSASAPSAPPPAPVPIFAVGDGVKTTAKVNVRSSPGIKTEPSNKVGEQLTGAVGVIVSGPVDASGYRYWQINFTAGVDGWVGEDRLTEIVAPAPTPPPPSGKFAPGDRVRATATVNVRSGPALSATKLGEQTSGAKATVLEGPVKDASSPWTYWRLDFDAGKDGWVGEDKLAKV